ncbi:MAPK kinase substrate protein-like protein [Tanacetum coccineum]
MEALPRSEISFRRSGSSGLVWDDKLLSGELKPSKPQTEEEREKEQQKSEPKAYKSVEVEPTIDPPSPKVSGCCSWLESKVIGKGVRGTGKRARFSKRLNMAGDHNNDYVNNMGNTENPSQQEEYNTIESVSMEHTEPSVTLSQPASNPGNCEGMFNVPSDLNTSGMRTHVDIVAELFGVSLKTPKDIDDFTKGIELGKYEVWSELTSDKRKDVMDTIIAMWDAFVAENPNVTSAYSSDSVKTGSLESMAKGNTNLDDTVHVDDPIFQSSVHIFSVIRKIFACRNESESCLAD